MNQHYLFDIQKIPSSELDLSTTMHKHLTCHRILPMPQRTHLSRQSCHAIRANLNHVRVEPTFSARTMICSASKRILTVRMSGIVSHLFRNMLQILHTAASGLKTYFFIARTMDKAHNFIKGSQPFLIYIKQIVIYLYSQRSNKFAMIALYQKI